VTADKVIDGYLRAAARHGAQAEVRLREDEREEMTVHAGRVEDTSVVRAGTVTVRLWRDGRTALAVVPRTAHSESVVAEALANSYEAAPRYVAKIGDIEGHDRVTRSPLRELHAQAAALTAAQDVRKELWINQVSRSVTVASTDGGCGRYLTSSGSLLYRATGATGGRRSHIDREDIGPDAAFLLARLPDIVAAPCDATLRAPVTDAPLPSAVVLDGAVASRLLFLYSRSLCADAVAQGRSHFAGTNAVGTSVAAPSVTLVDDPLAPDAPLHAPFDDEGTLTSRRVLVDRGVLAGFLGSREYPAPTAGNAWQESPSVPPRPTAGNLWIEPGAGTAAPDGEFLRVVQAYGMHLANDITGDFSIGVTALVERGGKVYGATGITIAGNVFEMLDRATPLATELTWSGGGSSYCAAPDLLVEGLTVGT
jgi:PmbA protein